ncbi:MAG TPA: hypothetical protein VKC55_03840 [Actinomycetota bacterium]|jgi:hypothetical protein|nr:hypothetical protein [Actinomycetota bacterium]
MDEATTGDRTLTDEDILTVAPGSSTVTSERPTPDGDDSDDTDSSDSKDSDSDDTDSSDSTDADGTDAAS